MCIRDSLAGLHYSGLLEREELEGEELERVGRFANLVAALSTTQRGAWSVPKMEKIARMREFRELHQRSSR
jgi:fructokinase